MTDTDFVELRCCDQEFGGINTRPFTLLASVRFEEIRARNVTADDPLGNGWLTDPAAKALLADPTSYGTLPDGHRFELTCPTCGASFVQIDGRPVRVPREVA